MKRGKSQKKIQIYPRDKLNPPLSLLCQLLENYETLETRGEVLRTILKIWGFKVTHLRVWALICHKDKLSGSFFWTFS